MPILQELYGDYHDKGLVVLGVNVTDDRAIAQKFLDDRGITLPNVHDLSESAEKTCRDYGDGAVPLNYLIDGNGVIVAAWLGHSEDTDAEHLALLKLAK